MDAPPVWMKERIIESVEQGENVLKRAPTASYKEKIKE